MFTSVLQDENKGERNKSRTCQSSGFPSARPKREIKIMLKLFEPIEINGMELKNRFVRSSTYEAMATEDGKVTELIR